MCEAIECQRLHLTRTEGGPADANLCHLSGVREHIQIKAYAVSRAVYRLIRSYGEGVVKEVGSTLCEVENAEARRIIGGLTYAYVCRARWVEVQDGGSRLGGEAGSRVVIADLIRRVEGLAAHVDRRWRVRVVEL